MKSISRFSVAFLAVFFLLCFFSRGAFAAETAASSVATTESITLGKGGTLWAVFKAGQFSNKDWPKYWEEASRLSGIPHTDAAWRKLAVGKVITAPRDPRAIQAESALRMEQALSELKTLSIELRTIEQRLAELDAKLAAINRLTGIVVLALFALGFIYAIVLYRRSKSKETIGPSKLEALKEADKPTLHVAPCCALPGDAPPSDMFSETKPVPPRWHPT